MFYPPISKKTFFLKAFNYIRNVMKEHYVIDRHINNPILNINPPFIG